MSDEAAPERVERAFADHGSFERTGDGRYGAATTPFDAEVAVADAGEGRIRFDVEIRVPMLGAATADGEEVAEVVEEGWYETFERRTADVGGLTAGDHDLDPTVGRDEGGPDGDRQVVVRVGFEDLNERRGVEDAAAVVNYVEGTFVQGLIPGYDYTEPAASLLDRARGTGRSQ
jgi:hypothetical protein